MKKGFTLQEILITMAIVGVIAALTVPGMVGVMPSKDKMQYLKAYNNFTKIISELADDTAAYPIGDDDDLFDHDNVDLTYFPDASEFQYGQSWDPHSVLTYHFSKKLNLSEEADCSAGNLCNFTSTDGIKWTFSDDNNNGIKVTIGTENYDFGIDLDYDGKIKPDAFGQELLSNPTKLKTKDFNKIAKKYPEQKKDKSSTKKDDDEE